MLCFKAFKKRFLHLLISCIFLTIMFPMLYQIYENSRNNFPADIFKDHSLNNHNQLQSKFILKYDQQENHFQINSNEIDDNLFLPEFNNNSEKIINKELATLTKHLNHSELLSNEKKYQIYHLLNKVNHLLEYKNNSNLDQLNDYFNRISLLKMDNSLKSKFHCLIFTFFLKLIAIFLGTQNDLWLNNSDQIHLPTLLTLLPHFPSFASLNPPFRLALNQSLPKRFVFGIPTVKRFSANPLHSNVVQSYLLDTLNSLILNLTPYEKEQSLFVVLVAEVI